MKKLMLGTFIGGLLVMGTSLVSHPHFRKTVSTKLGSADVKISYQTVTGNESYARAAAVGQFLSPRAPQFENSAELTGAGVSIPQGTYTVGVVKNGENDWSMVLYPGRPGSSMDMDRAIILDSMFSTELGTAEHILIDITPGQGKHEGLATLTIHFGSLFISGALS